MPALDDGLRSEGNGAVAGPSSVAVRGRALSSNIGVAPGVFATDVGAVEYPADISDAYDWAYDEPADERDTQDMDAFPPLRSG
jgi:hypothetical protein